MWVFIGLGFFVVGWFVCFLGLVCFLMDQGYFELYQAAVCVYNCFSLMATMLCVLEVPLYSDLLTFTVTARSV